MRKGNILRCYKVEEPRYIALNKSLEILQLQQSAKNIGLNDMKIWSFCFDKNSTSFTFCST